MDIILEFLKIFLLTLRDVLPILLLVIGFQLFVLKKPVPNQRKVIQGVFYVVVGLALFLTGLEKALFPLGKLMASQLSSPEFLSGMSGSAASLTWLDYGWVYLFAALIGFSTTIAEPSLIAISFKASEVSAGTVGQWSLRITVAIGVAVGITLGTFRIISGTPLYLYILVGYVVVCLQTLFAPKKIIPLAYDSGGVTTSTVTVPLVAALGLGLAESVPGRNPALDGFGLIAFASLFPIISVLGYAQISHWLATREKK